MGEEKPIHAFIGESEDMIIEQFGQPTRKDVSAYDYVWWVYYKESENYIQFGLHEGKVVTAFALGDNLSLFPFEIGSALQEGLLEKMIDERIEVLVADELIELKIDQNGSDNYLMNLGNAWAQLYVDEFTDKLMAIRYMDNETLVKQRQFDMVYRGSLLSPQPLSTEQIKEVEDGNERQVFEITNILRNRYNLPSLLWDEEIAKTAVHHSKDMKINDYFSHTSPTNGDLAKRLMMENIVYLSAGENIAAKYTDAPAVVIGWLNSESHRESLLHSDFTHLGVGVYEQYYTQNFIQTALD
ncbi:hypothetical protein BFG57_10660 [Bacillus solimangrovi]|uniref:SCP-like extracellular n=1 Tax=Bacillus solimangrovi TaxID=1305675 RepID=A0A1E5LIQ7_9BACI|nr:hypothetical protein BFG57_10660 [Bacillus solimangrovi]